MLRKINNLLCKYLNFAIIVPHPKHSIRFAKQYFKEKEITAIEIGTFEGQNAYYMLKNLNITRLYLIDPWEEYEEYKDNEKDKSQDNLTKAMNKTLQRLKNYKNKITLLKDFSSNAVNNVPKVDYVYIDGNHAYKYVLEDCLNYWDKVKQGGILAGHDISWKGTLNAVQDFCKEKNLHFQVAGQDWWIVKQGGSE